MNKRLFTIFILLIFIAVVFYLRTFITNPTEAATQIGTSLGTLPGAGKQVVRTATGTLYTFVNASGTCEVYKSTDGTSWVEQDAAHQVICTSDRAVGGLKFKVEKRYNKLPNIPI